MESDLSKIANPAIIEKYNGYFQTVENRKKRFAEQFPQFNQQRNPVFVIMRIIDAIPNDIFAGPSSEKAEFSPMKESVQIMIKELEDIIDSCFYADPHAWGNIWKRIAIILTCYIPDADCEWKKQIAAIFANTI
jgi:hypothetical protein